jgi:hypothetical protein
MQVAALIGLGLSQVNRRQNPCSIGQKSIKSFRFLSRVLDRWAKWGSQRLPWQEAQGVASSSRGGLASATSCPKRPTAASAQPMRAPMLAAHEPASCVSRNLHEPQASAAATASFTSASLAIRRAAIPSPTISRPASPRPASPSPASPSPASPSPASPSPASPSPTSPSPPARP